MTTQTTADDGAAAAANSTWRDDENRFEFACGCVFSRRSRSFRGAMQWRLEQQMTCESHAQEG